jgi:hypothetical protein
LMAQVRQIAPVVGRTVPAIATRTALAAVQAKPSDARTSAVS